MSLTTRVLVALLAGVGIGVGVAWADNTTLHRAVATGAPLGTLWVNAISMTVIPLVGSLLITGIASGSARQTVRIGGPLVAWFVLLVSSGALLAALVAPPLLSLGRFDAEAFAVMRDRAAIQPVELPPFQDWLVGLVPANPVEAAADGALLPLLVFATLFAVAMTRLDARHREPLVRLFSAISHTMMIIVEWILWLAPVGVFFIVLPIAAQTGVELVGALGMFLLIVCSLLVIALLALYPLAVFGGGVPLRSFARACAPAQAVAFSTRSSLASLPAMLEAADRELHLAPHVRGIVLPVGVSVFKYASPIARITGTLFVAQLYGVDLGVLEMGAVTGAIAALSFYSPGIPSGGLLIMTPIYVALNLPVEGIGLLIALDLIPDMFITTANVTADLAVAVVLDRLDTSRATAPPDSRPE